MAQKRITYLLGAGASCKAIPVVNSFRKSLDDFRHLINNHVDLTDIFNSAFNQSLNEIIAAHDIFRTVDTYARKLYLTGDNERLKWVKAVLDFYFLLTQFSQNPGDLSKRLPHLDPRYVPFISSFLEKGKNGLEIPEHIKFITWNYDMQLEMALEAFMSYNPDWTINRAAEHFYSYPCASFIGDLPTIVHLNGVAGLYTDGVSSLRLKERVVNSNFNQEFRDLTSAYKAAGLISGQWHSLLTFAWENQRSAIEARKYAKEIMEQTDVLVIIGYSFPVFNRVLDKELLTTRRSFEKVYYQDLVPNTDLLTGTFDLDSSRVVPIQVNPKADQGFFIPFEL